MGRPPDGVLGRLTTATQCTPMALAIVAGLTVTNVVLLNWSTPIFGDAWKYVMWEGGAIEALTVAHFLLGAVVYAACALRRAHPPACRGWFGAYALAELVLAGEETNYGQGTLVLDLADPNFAANYNPQSGNLHNFAPALATIIGFFVIVAVLRIRYRPLVSRLRLPMPVGFLNAVLLTGIGVVFMALSLRDDRLLALDEVYEWSSSFLLLCLALHFRWGWFFAAPAGHPSTARKG